MIGRAGLLGGAVILVSATGAQACHGDPFSLHFGSSTELNMQVKAAETCRFGFHPGRNSGFHSIAVTLPPQHGSLTQADTTHWIYRPTRGYTGPDTLRITTSGEQMGNRYVYSGETNLTYSINVVP